MAAVSLRGDTHQLDDASVMSSSSELSSSYSSTKPTPMHRTFTSERH